MSSSPVSREASILVAPDKFKGSATAWTVAEALSRGIRASAPRANIHERPIADGGDGTIAVLLSSGHDSLTVEAADALGNPSSTVVAVRDRSAVIEMSSTCGLTAESYAQPLNASSYGLGVALRNVVKLGYRDITLGLGGSASTDGGLGLFMALGGTALGNDGEAVTPDARGLLALHTLSSEGLAVPTDLHLRVACDVTAPLHGSHGAATTFGPQKGLAAEDVIALDAALVRLGVLLNQAFDSDPSSMPGAGAAGGVGAMASTALKGEIVNGADLVLDVLRIDDALEACDVVITGEGLWDSQTTMGKGPGRLAERAFARGRPVIVVAGDVAANARDTEGVVTYWSLVDQAGSVHTAHRDVESLLSKVGGDIGRHLPSFIVPPGP